MGSAIPIARRGGGGAGGVGRVTFQEKATREAALRTHSVILDGDHQ
jgi:hypothetical protein